MIVPTDLMSLSSLILAPEVKSISFLTGAGLSVAADIPDFRSPGGLYDTLRPELLTATDRQQALMRRDPTYVVSWEVFQENQFPYLEVRRPFILGTRDEQWKATIGHHFMGLIHSKLNKLTRVFTQNIDGLDFQCVPPEKIVSVHGTIRQASCESCETEYDYDEFCDAVRENIKNIYENDDGSSPKSSSPITCLKCGRAHVKPETVLFGRSLPQKFFECAERDLPTTDLLIVIGTSLVVQPANRVVQMVNDNTIRVVVNREKVGEDLGIRYDGNSRRGRDFFVEGNCESTLLDLIELLGWLGDLKERKELLPRKSADLLMQKLASI